MVQGEVAPPVTAGTGFTEETHLTANVERHALDHLLCVWSLAGFPHSCGSSASEGAWHGLDAQSVLQNERMSG